VKDLFGASDAVAAEEHTDTPHDAPPAA
jgi:hypothetical protein